LVPFQRGYTVKEPDGYFFVNPVELRKDRYNNPDNLPDSAFLFYYLGHNKTKTLKKAAKFEEGDPQRPAITGIVTGDEITGILNNLEPGVRSLVFTPKLNGQSEAYRVNRALFEILSNVVE